MKKNVSGTEDNTPSSTHKLYRKNQTDVESQ